MGWISKNPLVAVIVAVIALGIAGYFIFRSIKPAEASATNWSKVWCFDVAKGSPFVGTEQKVPPFAIDGSTTTDGSPAGVRAEVFSCGECSDESARFVGWLWKFTPEVAKTVQEMVNARPNGFVEDSPYDSAAARGDANAILIAASDRPGEWYPEPTDEASSVKAKVATRCNGQPAKPCPAK